MDSIGGMLNPIGKMPKTHYKNEFCNGFTGKKLMVYNGILMETIGISVMFLLGFYCFFIASNCVLINTAKTTLKTSLWHVYPLYFATQKLFSLNVSDFWFINWK